MRWNFVFLHKKKGLPCGGHWNNNQCMPRVGREQSGTGIYHWWHVSGPCHHNVPYKNKTTRTFEHRGEAWRVLVGAKVVLFIESIKLFDGKLFFERRFCCFPSIAPCRVVCAKFAHTSSLFNSPSSKTLLMWRVITVLPFWNNSAIWACVNHTVSFSKRTLICVCPSSVMIFQNKLGRCHRCHRHRWRL